VQTAPPVAPVPVPVHEPVVAAPAPPVHEPVVAAPVPPVHEPVVASPAPPVVAARPTGGPPPGKPPWATSPMDETKTAAAQSVPHTVSVGLRPKSVHAAPVSVSRPAERESVPDPVVPMKPAPAAVQETHTAVHDAPVRSGC
jgi:hypothetical protein